MIGYMDEIHTEVHGDVDTSCWGIVWFVVDTWLVDVVGYIFIVLMYTVDVHYWCAMLAHGLSDILVILGMISMLSDLVYWGEYL